MHCTNSPIITGHRAVRAFPVHHHVLVAATPMSPLLLDSANSLSTPISRVLIKHCMYDKVSGTMGPAGFTGTPMKTARLAIH